MAGGKEVKKEQDVLYVGLSDPIEIRRTILEATKDSVEMLQKFEKFRAVREEKVATINQLQEQLREVAKLVAKLKTEMPKVDIRIKLHGEQEMIEREIKAAKEVDKLKKQKERKLVRKPVKNISKRRELGELEKLEAELTNIEQKLGKI
jgi:4-hydroxy-3-methylbut-2-enyl diphosphate reductase IspH